MPYLTIAQQALARWRDAQRELEASTVDSPEWEQARADVESAKADYQRAIDDARREHKPVPPPFEEASGT